MPDAARLVDGGDVGHFESIEADSIVSWIDFTLGSGHIPPTGPISYVSQTKRS